MSDNDNPPEYTELRKRQRKTKSDSEADPSPSTTDAKKELKPDGHRHVLKQNDTISARDRNKNLKETEQVLERPERAREPKRENSPKKDDPNNGGGSQEG